MQPSGLVSDAAGNLFGVAERGGNGNRGGYGTIYELQNGQTFTGLYKFCRGGGGSCSDGELPMGQLVVDVSGNLYGVAALGGVNDGGTVFELIRRRTGWQFQKLYDFCSLGGQECTDGYLPYAGLSYAGAASGAPYDGVSPLYGVTNAGGGGNNNGVAYQLVPNGNSGWVETVLHTFCTQGGTNCTDGAVPAGRLLVDANGNLLGIAFQGGANHPSGLGKGAGVVFELVSNAGSWTENVLYDFCAQANCSDGALPEGALIQDSSGNVFGTTGGGGGACTNPNSDMGCGTVFKLSSSGDAWQETVLHAFCAKSDCTDGAIPTEPLTLDATGNLFGTTAYGGGNDAVYAAGSGTLFELSGTTFKVLYRFCALDECSDGSFPNSALIINKRGSLIGVTSGAFLANQGTVFSFKP
jgi:hypothetical protein